MRPFRIEIPEEQIDDLKRRLQYSRLPGGIFQVDSQDGISLPFMRRLMDYWREGFDWRAQEADIQGYSVHFLHKAGVGPAPVPLVLTHGWPGSFLEFETLIQHLTDRQAMVAILATHLTLWFLRCQGSDFLRPRKAPEPTVAASLNFGTISCEFLATNDTLPRAATSARASRHGLGCCLGEMSSANICLHWFGNSIDASLRLYKENRKSPLALEGLIPCDVPFAIAHFPRELPIPPRS